MRPRRGRSGYLATVAGSLVGRPPRGVHRRAARALFGATSLVPDQSAAADTVVVVDSPAVGAASVTSLGATGPSRPTFGVSSQTTPPSVRSVLASTSASTRSPSPSRHHS